jgi:uncharacterized protein YhbP (UPF0306 family)
MTPDAQQRFHDFLAQHSTLNLATLNAAGRPESAPLFFAADEGSLIWISGSHSRHSRNLAANNQAAVTIHNQVWAWQEIAGLQMEGEVNLVPAGPGRDRAWQVYRAKFPFVDEFQDDVSTSEFYRFTPRWVRLIDNRVAFGYKEEARLG